MAWYEVLAQSHTVQFLFDDLEICCFGLIVLDLFKD